MRRQGTRMCKPESGAKKEGSGREFFVFVACSGKRWGHCPTWQGQKTRQRSTWQAHNAALTLLEQQVRPPLCQRPASSRQRLHLQRPTSTDSHPSWHADTPHPSTLRPNNVDVQARFYSNSLPVARHSCAPVRGPGHARQAVATPRKRLEGQPLDRTVRVCGWLCVAWQSSGVGARRHVALTSIQRHSYQPVAQPRRCAMSRA